MTKYSMTKYSKSLISITIFVLIFAFTYNIEALSPKKATIDVNIINVRSGPGMDHATIGSFNKNTVHSILEEKDRWYKIPFNDKEGWIASWLVSVQNSEVKDTNTAASTIQVAESLIASLNVRTGPSTSFPVLSSIKPAEYYQIIDDQGEWLKIQLNTQNDAWVAKNLVNISTQTSSAVSSTQSVTVTATILNVRSEPSTQSNIVTKLAKGEQVQLLEVKDGWYKINHDATEGWIASEFASTNQPLDNTSTNNDGTSPNPSGEDISKEDTTEKKEIEVETAIVTVGILNVRAEPILTSAIIGKLHMDDKVEVIERQDDWLKITYNGTNGWIANWLVTTEKTAQPLSQVPQVIVPKTGINIRTGPDTTYSIIKSANEGDTFNIINTHGEWYEIKLSESEKGFIASWVVQAVGIESTDSNRSIAGLLKGKTIVVDPGHGGIDGGAIGSHFRTLEKDINLSTALLLESKLKAAGANVIMTRTTDRYLSLAQRVSISNTNKADAFISVHYNTNHNPTMNGTIVYYQTRNGEDTKLARIVQQEIVKRNGLINLNARQSNYYVLRENSQLAILVEAAFLSNYNDELVSRTRQFQDKVAEGIFQGIIKYFN